MKTMEEAMGWFKSDVAKTAEAWEKTLQHARVVVDKVQAILGDMAWGWDLTETIYVEDPAQVSAQQVKKLRKVGFKKMAKLPDGESITTAAEKASTTKWSTSARLEYHLRTSIFMTIKLVDTLARFG